jgi:hypothetical protein
MVGRDIIEIKILLAGRGLGPVIEEVPENQGVAIGQHGGSAK